jgi:hypothetical protein
MPNRKIKIIFFFLLLIIKFSWVFFINNTFKTNSLIGNFIATKAGDTQSYIEPIENYLDSGKYGMYMGEYTPFKSDGPLVFYPSLRTPHYGVFYLFFRTFFSMNVSFDLLAILQILLEVLSILAFASLCYSIIRQKAGYYIPLLVIGFSSWITFYACDILTESFTCSFIIFGLYFFNKWITGKKIKYILAAGFFIAYAMMMKPFLIPWMFFFALSILFVTKNFKLFIKYSLIFIFPLILVWSPWVIRNYMLTGTIIPLSKPTYYPRKNLVRSCSEFLAAWGGDPIWWEGNCKTAGTFFYPVDINLDCEYKFPDYVFTKDYTLEDLRYLRNQITRFQNDVKNDSMDLAISKKFDLMTASFIKNKPLHYYILAPLMRLKNSLLKSGSYYINRKTIPFLILNLFQTALYLLPLTIGGIGLLILGSARFREPMNVILLGLPLSLIFVLTFLFKLNEWRYFIYVYPLMILYMTQLFLPPLKELKKAEKM